MRKGIEEEKLYTLQELSEILGVSYRTIQNYLYKNKIAVIRLGHRTVRVKGAEILSFFAKNTTTAATSK